MTQSSNDQVGRNLDIGPLLDSEVMAGLDQLPFQFGPLVSTLSDDTIESIRDATAGLPAPEPSGNVGLTVYPVPDTDGVTVRVHRPIGVDGPLPCVYWMHGGGLVMGSAATDDPRFDRWSALFGCVGVSVDYRLAPETPYPGPLEDCYAGMTWVHANADMLGVDPTRIGIGGGSAGGGLAAGLALLARDRGDVDIAFQLLQCPMIDDRQITVSSGWSDPVWTPAANRYGWKAYLGPASGTDDVPVYASPARAQDLTGLPPTLITVGAVDGFSDEDIDYAVRLRHAGVPVELHVYPGAPHGFEALAPMAEVSMRVQADIENWLRRQLG